MTDFPHTDPQAEEFARISLAAQEERGYMLRFVLVALVLTVASWIYTAQSASRLNTDAIAQLDGFDSLGFEEKTRVLQSAFDDLKVPSFYGGPTILESFLPETEPYIDGLSEEYLVARFIAKEAFQLLPQAEIEALGDDKVAAERLRRKVLLSKARRKDLTQKDLMDLKQNAPGFGNYLSLMMRRFPIDSVTESERQLCQSFTPCLSMALGRRHPSLKDALILLHRYANQLPFTKKSEKFATRRLGYFIRIREHLTKAGIPVFTRASIAQLNGQTSATGTDVEVLKALRLHQWEALHRSQVMSVFLSIVTGFLTLLFWRTRRRL